MIIFHNNNYNLNILSSYNIDAKQCIRVDDKLTVCLAYPLVFFAIQKTILLRTPNCQGAFITLYGVSRWYCFNKTDNFCDIKIFFALSNHWFDAV